MRVTVVATGIGAERKADISLVSSEGARLTGTSREFASGAEQRPATDGNQALKAEDAALPKDDLEYLDIPAFLRKQAD